MEHFDFKRIIETLPYAYALHKLILDEQGSPCDYLFVDMNPLFEAYTGLQASIILGKAVTEVIPDIKKDSFPWIETYSRVALKGESIEFEQYSEALRRWYRVNAYSPSEGYFITLFSDITEQKKLELKARTAELDLHRQAILLDLFSREFPDQQLFLEYALQKALEFSDSQYGYIFFYDETTREFELNVFSSEVLKDSGIIAPKSRLKLEETGFWGEVVRQRKPLYNNDFQSPHPLKKGLPAGHVVLKRFLSVPIFIDQKIVAVVGLANRASAYNDLDVNQLILLMQSVWLINTQRYLKSSLTFYTHKMADILDRVPVFLSEFEKDTTLTFVNKAYCQYFHLDASDLIGRKFLDFIPPEEHDSILSQILGFTPESPGLVYTHRVILDGSVRWTEWQDVAVFNDSGEPVSYYSIGTDITERKLKEEEAERSLQLMNAMFDGHTAPMFLIEPQNGEIYLCNQAATEFFGYSKEEMIGMHVSDLSSLSNDEVIRILEETYLSKRNYITLPSRLKSGEIRIVDIFNNLILYQGKQLFFSIVIDSTNREAALRENEYLITHDYLTKVYNRYFFDSEYERLNVPENQPLAVITCDINGLKNVNQALGARAGDSLLIRFSETIQQMLHPGYVLARIGGDEFAILMLHVSEAEVKDFTIRLEKQAMAQTLSDQTEFTGIAVTASFGYGLQLNPADTLYMLQNEAEAFMLHRKYYTSTSKQSKVIDAIMNALYEKSEREQQHSKRVSQISVLIAEALKLSEHKVNEIKTAGILHDIGKIGIDDRILNKPSSLNAQEWMIMKQHPLRSARILIGVDEYRDIVSIVRAHHERIDGKGYPDGLMGEEIPLEARIIAVADSFDAMTVKRTYRDAMSQDEAVAELLRCSGSQFDPVVAEAFIRIVLPLLDPQTEAS